ncbi:MAG: universal stress protein [Candidatus Freyarchaeota archaeon]|nr:universal stress protein [Candidatus Jordarchaeia archaeon]
MEERLLREEWLTPVLKVFFPFTGRKDEINAAIVAFQIVEEMGGEVVGFHVIKNGKVDQSFVETVSSFAKEFKVKFHVLYREKKKKDVVEDLLSELEKDDYDLCVCSSGRGIRIFGDVASKLIKKSKKKMIVIHTPKRYDIIPHVLNRVLIVHKNLSEDINAYEVAMVLTRSRLSVRGEVTSVYPIRVHSSVPMDLTYMAEEVKREEENFIHRLGITIKDMGTPITPVTLYARNEAEGLAAYASEVKADIIVVGVNRKRYPSRIMQMFPLSYPYFLNNLLKRSPCPVLLVFS